MKYFVVVFLLAFTFSSCEKTIKITVQDQSPKLVVEASIENGQPAFVALSSSLNFFSSITQQELSNSFVHNAKIILSEGSKINTLKEYAITDTSGYTYYYYTVDSSNLPNAIIGGFNKQYQLTIQTEDGQLYTAQTTIPLITKTVDSIWWEKSENNPDTNRCLMYGKFTDPPGFGNYIRYFTKTNGNVFLPGLNSVFDDQVVDGKTYSVSFDMGYNKRTNEPSGEDYGFARRGDTVTLKFCNIDKATFNFWNTWEFSYQSYGNPFSSPIKVIGNISNGALGSFSGYAAMYKTIIIPK